LSDFTTVKYQVNSVSDASPTWNDVLLGTANYGLRFCAASAGGASIASASWPIYPNPASTGVVPECWGYFGSDASGGIKLATYDGTSAHYMQLRISWDALGTFATAPIISAWKDNTYPAAVPGTQPGTGDGSAVVNGQATDTNSQSYFLANAYGQGMTSAGSQQTPAANAAGTLTLGTHSGAGAAVPGSAAWLATWQDLQAATDYIQNGGVPKATTAGLWYMVMALFTGPNMKAGTLTPVLGFQYSWV
jgi:hypothetical protein